MSKTDDWMSPMFLLALIDADANADAEMCKIERQSRNGISTSYHTGGLRGLLSPTTSRFSAPVETGRAR